MKKIIITLLTLVGISGMQAQTLPVVQANTKFEGIGLQITITGYGCVATSTYGCNDEFTLVADASNTVTMTVDREKGNGSFCYYKFNAVPAQDAVNKFTLTHVPTGHCATITMTGSACTAVTACTGSPVTPDPSDPIDPQTIVFSGISFQNSGAKIYSSVFNGSKKEDYTVEAFEGNEENKIDVVLQDKDGDWILVNNSTTYNNFPYKFIITKNDGSCGIITATSATQFTQSACPTATSVSITEVTPGVDYINLEWNFTGYEPTHAYVLYKKATDDNFTSMVVSPDGSTARITGLAANTNYVVQVRLEQQDGEGDVISDLESEEATTKTASASMSLKQVGAYTNYLTIGWDVNFTAELYTVMYRKNGSKEEFLRYELSGAASSATITGLNEHTAYEVQVVAQLSAAQGGSRTATGVFTTLHRTSCNTVSYEDEESDGSFAHDRTCEFKQPYEVEVYTSNIETKEVTIRYHYTQPENIADNQVILLKREKNGPILRELDEDMTSEGNKWYKQVYQPSPTEILDGYVYFAIKVVTQEVCEEGESSKMYVTRKLNYKMGVGCNDATELEFTKGDGDKVFYLQTNATIARVEVYNPSGDLVTTPEITKPGSSYVLNIANDTTFPTGRYTFKLYDINGRLSDVKLIYAVY